VEAQRLSRIELTLEESLVERLRQEAHRQQVSVSVWVGSVLARKLGLRRPRQDLGERIRRLREEIGPMPESTTAASGVGRG